MDSESAHFGTPRIRIASPRGEPWRDGSLRLRSIHRCLRGEGHSGRPASGGKLGSAHRVCGSIDCFADGSSMWPSSLSQSESASLTPLSGGECREPGLCAQTGQIGAPWHFPGRLSRRAPRRSSVPARLPSFPLPGADPGGLFALLLALLSNRPTRRGKLRPTAPSPTACTTAYSEQAVVMRRWVRGSSGLDVPYHLLLPTRRRQARVGERP